MLLLIVVSRFRARPAGLGPGLMIAPIGALIGTSTANRVDGKTFPFSRFTLAGATISVIMESLPTALRRKKVQSEAFSAILRASLDHIYVLDRQGRYLYVSDGAAHVVGKKPDDMIGRTWQKLGLCPKVMNPFDLLRESVVASNQPIAIDMEFAGVDGLQTFEYTMTPINRNGTTLADVVVVSRDITEQKRAEETDARLVSIVESSDDAIIGKDLSGRVTSWNLGAERLFGYSSLEMLGCPIDRLIPPDRKDEEPSILKKLQRGERVLHFESLRLTKDGGLIDVSLTISPISDKRGRIIGISKIARDITGLKLAEKSVRESETRFRVMANAMPQLAWIARPDGHIFWYNQPWYDYTGTTLEQMDGWGLQSVHDTVELPNVLDHWNASIATGEPFEMTLPLRGTDGLFRQFLTRVIPLKDSAGQIVQWCGTNTDVDELSRANQALRDTEHRTRLATEATGVGIWEWNTMTNQIRWDAQMFRIYGIDPTEDGLIPYQTWRETVLDEDWLRQEEILQEAIRRQGESVREFRIRRPDDNRYRDLEVVARVRTNAEGHAPWLVGTTLDITERRQAAEAQARLAEIVKSSDDSIMSEDLNGFIMTWNEGARRIFGYESDEAIGRPVESILTSYDHPTEALDLVAAVRRGEPIRNFETRKLRKDGSLVHVSVTISLILDQSGKGIGVSRIHRDITGRHRAEKLVHRREQELSDFFENATIGFHWAGPDGILLRANNAELEMLGYASEDYVGHQMAEFHVSPELSDDILRRLHSGETIRDQPARVLHKDGSTRDVLIDSSVLWEDGQFVHTRCYTRDITEKNRSEVAREESERMARSILDSLSVNIAVLDEAGNILAVNRSWIEFAANNQASGGTNEEANYLRICEKVQGEDSKEAAIFAKGIREVLAGRQASFSLEYSCHSHTKKRWFIGRVVPFLGDGLRRVVVSHLDVTEQKQADEALRNYSERLEALSRQLLRAQEDERRRISRELHDEIGQTLTAAKIAVDRVARLPALATWGSRLTDVSEMIGGALDQVRHLSRLLRPSILDDLGLEQALADLSEGISERTGLNIHFEFDPQIGRIDREIETTCYRMTQEALNNAVKHSQATKLNVSLRRIKANLELIIADNGAGFDVAAIKMGKSRDGGLGLLGLYERAQLAGGLTKIESQSGVGTQISAILPAERREQVLNN